MGSYEDQNSYFGVWYIGKLLDEMRLNKQTNKQKTTYTASGKEQENELILPLTQIIC